MFGNVRRPRGIAPLVALAAALTAAGQHAEAQVVPFKIKGGGTAEFVPVEVNDPARHDAEGWATHLGRYSGEGAVRLDRFTSPTTAEFSSAEPFVFTAANGDKLAFHYGRTDFGARRPGVVELFPVGGGLVVAVWVAEFNPVPARSTGRFRNVTGGSFIMIAVTEPFVLGSDDPVDYWWEGEGTIEFSR